MIQAVLDNYTEKAAEIAVQYTNGKESGYLTGARDIADIENQSMRVVYLWGVINHAYLTGTTPYIGGTAITDAYLNETMHKLWHYNGVYEDVDLSSYSEITPDDGDGGAETPDAGTPADNMRVGTESVTTGPASVTFEVNGYASPLDSANYVVSAWVISNTGYRQDIVDISGQTAAGFTANNIIAAGTLYYIATLIS